MFGIIGIILAASAGLAYYFSHKQDGLANRSLDQTVVPIAIFSDSVSLERGKTIAVMCRICHENDYSGKAFFNDNAIGTLYSPNITSGKGSATEKYNDMDWIRTLRHGLNPNGRPLMVMPSDNLGQLSDRDLGSLIGYLKSLKPIDKPKGSDRLTFFGKILAGAGAFGNLFPYDIIEHQKVDHIQHINLADTIEYGNYLTRYHGCRSCHGKSFNGGISADPTAPAVPNITPHGHIGSWSLMQFRQTLRGGVTPEGKQLNGQYMPWSELGAHSDDELSALYQYLHSLPALEDSPEYKKKAKS